MDEYINKNSPIPYYVQLKEIIGNKIDNNDFEKNKLWSENEFAKTYGVNFLTVRKALNELRNEGRIFTIKGVGTLIKEPKLEIDISKFLSFGKALKDKGLAEEINVIKKKVIDYKKNLFGKYEIKNCSKKIIYMERFRNINNEPIAYEK
ncbi:MAG: GntR family transcriptional regulator, partial [Candidatus Humimicrobiaceae bacterium]